MLAFPPSYCSCPVKIMPKIKEVSASEAADIIFGNGTAVHSSSDGKKSKRAKKEVEASLPDSPSATGSPASSSKKKKKKTTIAYDDDSDTAASAEKKVCATVLLVRVCVHEYRRKRENVNGPSRHLNMLNMFGCCASIPPLCRTTQW